MPKTIKIGFFLLILFGVLSIGSLVYFSDQISVLSPQGLIALKQSQMLRLSTYLMLIVVIPVFLLTFFIAWKYRESNQKSKYNPDWDHNIWAEVVWWGIPCVLIVILGWITYVGCHELDPFKPIVTDKKPLKIQVVALRWKWLFIYPEEKIATVNWMQFPVETPISLEVTSDAPMNGFWIPDLAGQVYAMAGMKAKLHLIANHPGVFRGFSSNISGPGFSGMAFKAKASSQEEYDEWVQSIQQSSASLNWESYKQLAEPSEYNPVTTYTLGTDDLFHRIIMKYMPMENH